MTQINSHRETPLAQKNHKHDSIVGPPHLDRVCDFFKLSDSDCFDWFENLSSKIPFSKNFLLRELDQNKNRAYEFEDLMEKHRELGVKKFETWFKFFETKGVSLLGPFNVEDLKTLEDYYRYACVHDIQMYKILPESLKNDAEFMIQVAHRTPDIAQYYPKENMFFTKLVREVPQALRFAPHPIRDDLPLALYLIRQDATIFDHFSERLRNNKKLVLETLRFGGNAAFSMGHELYKDLEVAKASVAKNPLALWMFAPKIKENVSVVLIALKKDGNALKYADDRLKSNLSMALEAVKQNHKAIQHVSPSLIQDEKSFLVLYQSSPRIVEEMDVHQLSVDTLVKASRINKTILHFVTDPNIQNRVWRGIKRDILDDGVERFSPLLSGGESFFKALNELTHFPQRFKNYKTIDQLLSGRVEHSKDGSQRPIAVVIGSRNDWNLTFEGSRIPDMLMEEGSFLVLYYEVSNERDFLNVLKRVSENGKRPIHTLIIRAHGHVTLMNLGPQKRFEEAFAYSGDDEVYNLDVEDVQSGDFDMVSNYLSPQGQVVLDSCLTAKENALSANLAQQFSKVLTPGIVLYANDDKNSILSLKVNKENLRLRIHYRGGHGVLLQGQKARTDHERVLGRK